MLEVAGTSACHRDGSPVVPADIVSIQMLSVSDAVSEDGAASSERPAVFGKLCSDLSPKDVSQSTSTSSSCGGTGSSSRSSSSDGSSASSSSSGGDASLPGNCFLREPCSPLLHGRRVDVALPSRHSEGNLTMVLTDTAPSFASTRDDRSLGQDVLPEEQALKSGKQEEGEQHQGPDGLSAGLPLPPEVRAEAEAHSSGDLLLEDAVSPSASPGVTSPGTSGSTSGRGLDGVPLFVMLPLDVVTCEGELRSPKALEMALQALKSAGVQGVMGDIWWGVVERQGPGRYNWAPYKALLQLVRKSGLLMQAVMSFHACGNNVGDHTRIPLPPWIEEQCFQEDPAIFYRDRAGNSNPECISLFSDTVPCLAGRTPIQVYEDFMRGFKEAMGEDMTACVSEVAVGMGPCGELRYPSYPEGDGRWRFPGIGEFQCFDSRALEHLKAAAERVGEPDWGLSGPHDAGTYKLHPQQTGFFRHPGGSWNSPYGHFFLSWYSDALVEHQERMLAAAVKAFHGVDLSIRKGADVEVPARNASAATGVGLNSGWKYHAVHSAVHLSVKCAGIHWWYQTASHAAELTAGYYNPWGRNGYEKIVRTCGRYGAGLNFTCVEMTDVEQPAEAQCGPEELVNQVRACASKHSVSFAGENALARLDQAAYDQILRNATRKKLTVVEMASGGAGEDEASKWSTSGLRTRIVDYKVPLMSGVTFLRLTPRLFEEHNFALFMKFVGRLKAGGAGSPGAAAEHLRGNPAGAVVAQTAGTDSSDWREPVVRTRSSTHGRNAGRVADSYRASGSGPYRGSHSSSASPQDHASPRHFGAQTELSCATPPPLRPPQGQSHGHYHFHHNPSYYHSYHQFPQPHQNHHIVHHHAQPDRSAMRNHYQHLLSPTHRSLECSPYVTHMSAAGRALSPVHLPSSLSLGRHGSSCPRGSSLNDKEGTIFELNQQP